MGTHKLFFFIEFNGMVRCGEGVVYLASLGCPTDIGKACSPCSK